MKKIVFDLGFFNGQDTLNYIKKGYRVVAVEANPVLYERNKKKFSKYIVSKKLIFLNKIFSKSDNSDYFYYNPYEIFRGSVKKKLASPKGFSKKMFNLNFKKKIVKCKLPTVNLQKLVNEYGTPYYIKFDMDGVEKAFIESLFELTPPQHLSVEFDKDHSSYFLNSLKKMGYKKFLFVNQIYNTSKDSFFSFVNSSGDFGPYLKQKYYSFSKAKKIYKMYRNLRDIDQRNLSPGWLDLHVTY
jgi:FkbM family methyltransferase